MKRYSAFALRGFDSARILQRRFFASLNLPNASDEQIIEGLKPVQADSVDDMEQRLRKIKSTHELLLRYRQLMNNHVRRCDRFDRAKGESLGVRPALTIEIVTAELDVAELIGKFTALYHATEKTIQKRYRQDFVARIKQERLKRGLRQKELASLVEVSPQGFSRYERDEREIPIHVLIRLSKALNVSADKLLGIG